MSSGEFERSSPAALTALPSLDQLRRSGEGFDEDSVRDAFEACRRHTSQLQCPASRAAGRQEDVEAEVERYRNESERQRAERC